MNQERIIKGNLLHTLAARSLIRDLEEARSHLHSNSADPSTLSVKEEVIRLGTKYGYGCDPFHLFREELIVTELFSSLIVYLF